MIASIWYVCTRERPGLRVYGTLSLVVGDMTKMMGRRPDFQCEMGTLAMTI